MVKDTSTKSGFVQRVGLWWSLSKGSFTFYVWPSRATPGKFDSIMFYAGKKNTKSGYSTVDEACSASLARAIDGTRKLLSDLEAMVEKEESDE